MNAPIQSRLGALCGRLVIRGVAPIAVLSAVVAPCVGHGKAKADLNRQNLIACSQRLRDLICRLVAGSFDLAYRNFAFAL